MHGPIWAGGLHTGVFHGVAAALCGKWGVCSNTQPLEGQTQLRV